MPNIPMEDEVDKEIKTLDEGDIALLKTYGPGPNSKSINVVEDDIPNVIKPVNELTGIKESDTGLAPPALRDSADKQTLEKQNENPIQVARCTKIILGPVCDDAKYIISVKQFAKFVVDLIFFGEIDGVRGARLEFGAGGDIEVQRTMLKLINQLDGFHRHWNIKLLLTTIRPDTLDPMNCRKV